ALTARRAYRLVHIGDARRDLNGAYVVHRVTGIDAEIEKHLLELDRIDEDCVHIVVRHGAQLDRRRQRRAQHLRCLVHERRRQERQPFTALTATEHQHLPYEIACPLRSRVPSVGITAAPRIAQGPLAFLGEHDKANDALQYVVEVVRNAAGELTDRLHLLRLAKLRLENGSFGLGALAGGNVAPDVEHVRFALVPDGHAAQFQVPLRTIHVKQLRFELYRLAREGASVQRLDARVDVGRIGQHAVDAEDVLAPAAGKAWGGG